MTRKRLIWGALLCHLVVVSPAFSQTVPPADGVDGDDTAKIRILLRTTLIALNHANLTGNYAVLRDLGTPKFKSTFTPADLAAAFADIRAKKIDLSSIAVVDPTYQTPIPIDENGVLKIDGFFPTEPVRINFSAAFQLVDGKWMMAGLSVKADSTAPQEAD